MLSVTEDIIELYGLLRSNSSVLRAWLFVSEMRLNCMFLSKCCHAYLSLPHLPCLPLWFAQMLSWFLTGLGSFYMSKSI